MIGLDSYPGNYNYDCGEAMFKQLQGIVGNRKMIGMTENGPIPDMQKCLKQGVNWGLFMAWNDLVFSQNSMEHIDEVYRQSVVRSLDDQKVSGMDN